MDRWLCALLLGLMGGCASAPCVPAPEQSPFASPPPQPAQTVSPASPVVCMEHGRPNRFLDGTGRILGAPRQLILWNRRVANHQVSPATEQILAEYMSANDLPEVVVRVNQYAPLAEWRRLRNNHRVGAGWRYTVGAFDVLMYTVMPGRLGGADWYNPFTDTINLYSDVPAIALHEAAYAKNIHHRPRPGTYAVLQHLPLVGMWYRTNATQEALQYLQQHGGADSSQEADRVLFPMYGGALGGQIGQFVPIPFVGAALNLTGTGVGHIVGRYHAYQERRKEQEAHAQLPVEEAASQTIVPATYTSPTRQP